jgi:hypothetical protein
LVPKEVKESISPVYLIKSEKYEEHLSISLNLIRVLVPADAIEGPSLEELLHWFGMESSAVLRFHSLYTKIHLQKEDAIYKENSVLF